MNELPDAVKGLEHYTPEMHMAFNDTFSAINRVFYRFGRKLYPDDDAFEPYGPGGRPRK